MTLHMWACVADFFYLINLQQSPLTIAIRLIEKWHFNTLKFVCAWHHVPVGHKLKKKKTGEQLWSGLTAAQGRIMSRTINGGDVDCICVWIHKIYSLLSGASKCIQTINYPSSSSLVHWVTFMFIGEEDVSMKVWFGPLKYWNCF